MYWARLLAYFDVDVMDYTIMDTASLKTNHLDPLAVGGNYL